MQENKYYSYNIGQLPEGCRYCVKGEKLVLFITGICPRKCYFCPVSDQKYQQDVIFANERKVTEFNNVIKEAKLMKAKGAGITGGDPLAKLDRTLEYITLLKKEFGKEFHVHLYTSLNLVDEDNLKKLYQAGLDEIRFHLDLDNNKFWKRLESAKKLSWSVGVEIPLIPDKEKETKKLIDYVCDKVDFLNLNELEVADNKQSKLLEMNFQTKGQLSYAVKGSLELGLKLIEYVKEKDCNLKVHLCTAKLKDKVQLANRIKRESQGVKKSFDIVDKEGMLIRGALYFPELTPGFEYRKKLAEIDKYLYIEKLKPLLAKIKTKLKLKDEDISLDKEKPRILVAKNLIKKKKDYFHKLNLKPAIVMEYPTVDQLEIEVDFL
ncbi:MAG: radical SAM protein [Nanoarchaeota archaeon]|nr:radical SAM protein [Nanoarchaeota archaeon]MBU1632089.1 radical SAM protein [Nanoarchaeota archaeon]MBU1875723.1 radical SAM protein [Nanoarchaeota archaeon]